MRRIGPSSRLDESDEDPPDDYDVLDDALSVTEAWLRGANGTVSDPETVLKFLDVVLARLTTLRES